MLILNTVCLHYGSCACAGSQQGLNPKSHSRSVHRTITKSHSQNSWQCSDKDGGARRLIYPAVPFLKVAFTKDLRLIPCKQQGHSPLLFSVYNYSTCTLTLSAIIVQLLVHAIIVQVQVQTLFVNFVIANSIQVTIISLIALTCFCFVFFHVTHWRLVS